MRSIDSRRLPAPIEIQRRIDNAHMAERLREVAQHALIMWIVLF